MAGRFDPEQLKALAQRAPALLRAAVVRVRAAGAALWRNAGLRLGAVLLLTALGVAAAAAGGLVLYRIGAAAGLSLLGQAPELERVVGLAVVALTLVGAAALLLVLLALGLRLAAHGLGAAAGGFSLNARRLMRAAALAAAPALIGYAIIAQGALTALPAELLQYLLPATLPFAIGAACALALGRSEALHCTGVALLAMAGVVVAAGYLDGAQPGPLALVQRWAELMRAVAPIARVWWLLLVLAAAMAWAIAVFMGYRVRAAQRANWPSMAEAGARAERPGFHAMGAPGQAPQG